MAKRRKKAVMYLRVSGKGQVAGDGFPRQRRSISKYAARHGFEILEEFADKGVSGTKDLEHREGLAALLERLDSNGVTTVLVERPDRLARDLMVGEIILEEFRERGITVIETDGGSDLTVGDEDPTRKLIRQVLGAVAEFEKSVIVLKLRAARERIRSRRGRCEGRKPYGQTEEEKAALDRIRQLNRKPKGGVRRSYGEIAKILNREKVPTRMGRPWSRSTVHAIIARLGFSRT